MNATEQARFEAQEGYTRAVRRAAAFFSRCPGDLSAEELRVNFANLLKTHSWSAINIDRCGLQLFYRHGLDRPWTGERIVRPPRPKRQPDEVDHSVKTAAHQNRI